MYLACRRPRPVARPEFARILRPDISVINITRPLDTALLDGLAHLAQVEHFHHGARLSTINTDPSDLLVSVHDETLRTFLADDIRLLAGQLGVLLNRQHLHAQLFIQRSDGCRKIHADNVSIRLLCTYAGPGTDWLPDQDVNRKYLGASKLNATAANKRIIRRGSTLRRTVPGEVLLLKGNAHPGNAGRGAAHRSPPLGASSAARLVLKIGMKPIADVNASLLANARRYDTRAVWTNGRTRYTTQQVFL